MTATQNPAQDVSGALRQAAIVLKLWEGEPDETGYMGDFNDAAQILLILADHAARELQQAQCPNCLNDGCHCATCNPYPGELQQAQPADVWESYKTWPADIRAKLSCHDLRRMSGWAAKSPIADWRIDTSAGGPILVYQNCSVIESEQAQYVLNLIAQDQQAELQQAQPVSADEINALPEKIRRYIHDLETEADPAGTIRQNILVREENEMLRKYIELQQAQVVGADVARLMELVYVPGAWRCPKCSLRLIASTLSMGDGGIHANNEPQECANGCGSMWRVTEREDRQEAQRFAIEQAEALTTPQSSAPVVGDDRIMQAIARGWCSEETRNKEMDVTLAKAIHAEVMSALTGRG